jgi:hypothetical protein
VSATSSSDLNERAANVIASDDATSTTICATKTISSTTTIDGYGHSLLCSRQTFAFLRTTPTQQQQRNDEPQTKQRKKEQSTMSSASSSTTASSSSSSIASFQEDCIVSIATQLADIAQLTVEQARSLVTPSAGGKGDSGDYQITPARINKIRKLTQPPAEVVKEWSGKVSCEKKKKKKKKKKVGAILLTKPTCCS